MLRLIERFPAFVYAGAGLLGWIAGETFIGDPGVGRMARRCAALCRLPGACGRCIGHSLDRLEASAIEAALAPAAGTGCRSERDLAGCPDERREGGGGRHLYGTDCLVDLAGLAV